MNFQKSLHDRKHQEERESARKSRGGGVHLTSKCQQQGYKIVATGVETPSKLRTKKKERKGVSKEKRANGRKTGLLGRPLKGEGYGKKLRWFVVHDKKDQ